MKNTLLIILLFTLLLFLFEGCISTKKNQTPQQHAKFKHQQYDTLVKSGQGKFTLNAIDFLTAPRGITVGNSGTIFLTKSGGHTWDTTVGAGLTSVNLFGVSIVDPITYVAVGEFGSIYRTIDSAFTWDTAQSLFSFQTLRAVAFDSNYNGYAVGDSGVIFLSTNGGANWKKVHGNSSQTLNGIAFNSRYVPYVVGNNGLILRSRDNGLNWDSIAVPTTKNLNGIHFTQVDFHLYSKNGFVVGDSGTLIKTTNDGQNWDTLNSGTTENLRSVFISAPHWGYAVGDNGTVVRYNGKNWTLIAKPTDKRLNAVDPSWNPTPVCVGEDGLILDINPPSVSNQYKKAVEIPTLTGTGCTWGFTINLIDVDLQDEIAGALVTYGHFEICSSMEMSVFGSGTPTIGWADNERYFSVLRISPNNYSWTSTDPNFYIAPLTFTDPSGEATGYVTCYYIGTDGNPYLAVSAEIDECP